MMPLASEVSLNSDGSYYYLMLQPGGTLPCGAVLNLACSNYVHQCVARAAQRTSRTPLLPCDVGVT